jgi:hypothetical protein
MVSLKVETENEGVQYVAWGSVYAILCKDMSDMTRGNGTIDRGIIYSYMPCTGGVRTGLTDHGAEPLNVPAARILAQRPCP